MGIRDLAFLNKVLHEKWSCRYYSEMELHGRGWCFCGVKDGFRVGVWKVIMEGNKERVGDFKSRTFFEVGQGREVKF